MALAEESGLVVALPEAVAIHVLGACRIRALAGAVDVLGTRCEACACGPVCTCGRSYVDVIVPPWDSALDVAPLAVVDLRSRAFDERVRAVLDATGSSSVRASAPHRDVDSDSNVGALAWNADSASAVGACALLSSLPGLEDMLRDYDVARMGLPSHVPAHTDDRLYTGVHGAAVLRAAAPRGGASSPRAVWMPWRPGPPRPVHRPSCRVAAHIHEPSHTRAHASACASIVSCAVPPVVVVCGEKGAGKSTFTRRLGNAWLAARRHVCACTATSAYVLLDVDMGQPEHACPGLVTLSLVRAPVASPPHTRVAAYHRRADATCAQGRCIACIKADVAAELQSRTRHGDAALHLGAVFIGSASPKIDPDACVRAARQLIGTYKALKQCPCSARGPPSERCLPLIVNTCGWTKGLGAHVTDAVLAALGDSCTHIVNLQNAVVADLDEHTDVRPDTGDVAPTPQPIDEPEPHDGPAPREASSPIHDTPAEMTLDDFERLLGDTVVQSQSEPEIVELQSWKAADGAGVPRHTRAPAELRALRWLSYFTSDLQQRPLTITERRQLEEAGLLDDAVRMQARMSAELASIHHRVVVGAAETRAPVPGWSSIAAGVLAARCVCVKASRLLPGLEYNPVSMTSVDGQIVALLASPAETCLKHHEPVVPSRECLGYAFVRRVSIADDVLELVAPASDAVWDRIAELSVWRDGSDVPITMLSSTWLSHDAFCADPSDMSGGTSASTTTNRKQLKRRRLQSP